MGTNGRKFVALASLAGLLAPGLLRADTAASSLATETLAAIAGLSPQDYGAATVDGLEYADPTEAMQIIDAPEPNSDGSVGLSYPLGVPPGHGITPELVVQYGSGGGNGWMGLGWDLSVGEITVDTTFGAPHFSEAFESESYLLNGALLTPNANDDAWKSRVDGDRSDFSRQVETEYDEIIRHQVGTDWPADYFWEVRGKDGSVQWFGGTPDSGGPVPATAGSIDESAVIRNEAGHIVTWLLSAQRDIGVNLIRYEYETIEYEFDGANWDVADCDPAAELCGKHTYLDRILYTDATSSIADRNGPPYEIDFIRESEPVLGNAASAVRQDPVVDAGLGYVDVVVDRLGRVEVKHGAAPATGTTRNYNTIAARYEFTYESGRFGKSLLTEIIQGVDDPHVHEIDYYDDLTGTPTAVNGFATGVPLATGPANGDVADITFLDTTADVSALGGSETNGGSGNLYIGFNPISPSKTFSVGVGIELSGSDTNAIVEWIDLNGDGLSDKVFLDGSTVKFRLNNTGPGGAGGTWPLIDSVTGMNGLSKNSNFGFQVSAEAYPLVALGLGTGLAFSWTSTYFTDVNGDGLVDFVSGGTVYFNRLDANDIPTFSTSSAGTAIPLDSSPLPSISSAELAELSETLALQSPPVDTVRRFIAPYTGTVSIAAEVALDGVGATSGDGVRVAIQHNESELDDAVLQPGVTTSAFAAPIPLSVTAGDRLYFRVGARDDGANDSVEWKPVITYQSPTWPATDANGMSQVVFSAESDFTLAGRPSDFIAMPYSGNAQVDASVTTTAPLTDTLTVVAVKRDPNDVDTAFVLGAIPEGTPPGTFPFTQQIPVALIEVPDDQDPSQINIEADKLSVYIAVDSPVDLSDIDFSSTITYDSIVGGTGSEEFEHHVRPHIEIYPYADATTGAAQTSLSGDTDVLLTVQATPDAASGIGSVNAVIAVKSVDGLEAKVDTTLTVLPDGTAFTPNPVSLGDIGGPADKWVEVMIRDNVFSRDGLTLVKFVTVPAPLVETPVSNVVLRWSGMQGIFPQPYRGWGIAGYTAGEGLGDVRMLESAFVIDPSSYPTDEPTRADASLDEAHTQPSYAFVPAPAPGGGTTADPVATDRWVGSRANLYGDATTISTSRLAVDSVDFSSVTAPATGGGRSAPTRLGISGPGLTLSFGIGPLGASAALSPSFGLTDFEDLNGDGYPDVISTGNVTYTNQLGTYLDSRSVDRTSVTNQDLTIAINGGLSAGMVDIVPNTKGSTNAVDADAAGKGSSASDSGPSFSLGISGSGGYSWTSPNASTGSDPADSTYGEQVNSLQSDFSADTGEIQRAFADVNGDGLPDSVYTTDDGVFAFYNLGYGFARHAVKLGSGGFESRESATGGAGLGFSLPYGEFGGGVNLLFNYDWSTYSWRDINGDGIPDRLRRASPTSIRVAFGTGSGVLPEIDYGDLATVPVSPGIDGGQHIAFDRASGIGGGVSATAYIGPLCLVACYLVIGGGGGYNNSRSSSSVDLDDVNGDGFADSLVSLNDEVLTVSLNQQGRTNLLQGVTNPFGGSFTVDYDRKGNTVDHPDSIWVMKRVDIYDGRSDAVEQDADFWTTGHYASSIAYSGLSYDRTHRASLGFDTVTITELDTTDGDKPLRINEQRFLNENIFVKGLMTTATMFEPDATDLVDGRLEVRGSTVTWGFNVVRASQPIADDFDAQSPVVPIDADQLGAEVHSIASRGWSIAPLIVAHDEYWYDGPDWIFERRTEFAYDGLGNVLVEADLGAPDDDSDDLTTTITYSSCTAPTDTINGCLAQSSPRQPFWSPGTCVNWASYPTRVTVEGIDRETGSSVLLRERISPVQMCDNGAATVQHELVSLDGGTATYATTNMTLNQYGDYELVMAPAGADGIRYTVRYRYDADRHSGISSVEEFDVPAANATAVLASGPTAANSTAGISSSATFDPLSGRVDSRTDANDATRRYVYDEHGRIVETSTIATPTSPSTNLITYEYHANDPGYGYAIASHVDTFDGNDPAGTDDAAGEDTTATIDTITFVDGLGRVRQTKRDARLSIGGVPVNTRQVSGGVDFDPLARPVIEYGPTADLGPATSFSPDATSGTQTVTSWFSYDLREFVVEPGDRTTTFDYPWESINGSPLLAWTVATDPEDRVTIVAQDVRDVQRFHIDQPAPRTDANGDPVVPPPDLLTEYVVNSLGELLQVVDSAGAVSEYEYDLVGRLTSATTPNGGTVRTTYDLAGNQRVTVNDAMQAVGEQTSYRYQFNRLTAIDHPGTVDDITYEYGLDNDDGRFTAGRIRHIEDRTRLVDNTYDKNGSMIEQTAIIKRHNWSPALTGDQLDKFTYTTMWTYDDLGRIATVGYPDSKTVSYVPAGTSVGALTSPDLLSTLLQTEDLDGETVSYQYDSGGLLRAVSGIEEGIELVDEQIAPDIDGNVVTIQVPRRTDHEYSYLNDRQYDPWLFAIRDEMGNGTVSDYAFDEETRWLEAKTTSAPNPDPAVASPVEIQDLEYTYDIVGRPKTYDNNLPLANRAINGGDVAQRYSYDGFGRLRGATGTFDLKAGEQQQYTYGVEFTPEAPWSVVRKAQTDALVTTKGKPSSKVDVDNTYSFERELDAPGGPLQAVSDQLTIDGSTETYTYQYNANGAIDSMLAPAPGAAETPPKNGKPAPEPAPSETNVWDRTLTWTLMNQLTSMSDGSELRTFAYDDTGALMIQDGNLLSRDGEVLAESGGGPETIFLNAWTTIRSEKIYKHVHDGLDKIVTKMDSGASYEDKQMFIHTDVVGSTNMVTDNQGRGFQRHEYFPSGEIWINDHKEEIRTPFQFGDGYYEDEFDIILFGARWYDTERELFLSPDPLLAADPQALIDQPSLGGAYTYAGASAVSNVDPSGLSFFGAHQRVAVKARAQEAFDLDQFALKSSGEGDQAQTKLNQRIKLLKGQARAEAVREPAPLVKIDLKERKVSLGAPYGPRKEWSLPSKTAPAAVVPTDSADNDDDSLDATNGSGGPNAGNGGASPGSASASVADSDADATNDPVDDAGSGSDDSPPADQPPPPKPVQQGAAGADDNRGDD